MAPNEARKTLGYAEPQKLGLSRREKARTLGYHQLPNGDVNPTALGAPLTLAPKPVTLGLDLPPPPPPAPPPPAPPPPTRLASLPEPPRPAARQHLQLVPRIAESSPLPVGAAAPVVETAPRSTRQLELLPRLPVAKLTRAKEVPSDSLLGDAAFGLVRRRATTLGEPWFHQAAPLEPEEIEVDLDDEAPRSPVRSIVVKTLAALSFLACVAGAFYVAHENPAAITAVTSWATLGQAK